ncbi:WYL domain-containing protein [Butyricimonas hominis]|uniref:helix-turn-helix transcriptional regulator n=1 Tax=Butyricimonas TaxID=574697 RepID=UPI0035124877
MPTNKNAQLRYQVLDKCLSNWSRRYYIEDLVEACNDALYLHNGETKNGGGVKKRQVQEDLKFIGSEEGYAMDIDAIQDGHRRYYRYHEKDASIKKQPINQEEIDLIHDALLLLRRFEGVPQFEWLDDLEKRLYTTSKLGETLNSVVCFQHNPYLRGMDAYYKPIFDSIVSKRVVEIVYHPFGKEARTIVVNPYYLKQYNNRWFLIGKHKGSEYLSNFAIDRIEGFKETSKPYEPLAEDIDLKEYFSDVVGVSLSNALVENVVLRVSDKTYGYIVTKPLHESQSTVSTPLENGYRQVTLKVQNNYELRSLLRSFGEQIEVLAPESLRQMMKDSADAMSSMYSKTEAEK